MRNSKAKRKLVAVVGCICAVSVIVASTNATYATELPSEVAISETDEIVTAIVSETSGEGITESSTENVTESSGEGMTEPSTEDVTEPSGEASTENMTESSGEASTENVTESSGEISTENMTGSSAETSAEGITTEATIGVTETTAQNPSDGTTGATEATTGVTEVTTGATQAPTQEPTQAPTQAPPKNTVDSIGVDGDVSEWKAMDSQEVADDSVGEWKVTKSEDGSMLYLCFTGTASTQWDQNYIWKTFTITYENGTSYTGQFATMESSWINPGATVSTYSNASGTNPGNYAVECALPVTQGGYTISFAGTTVSDADIPGFVAAEVVEPVYNGIVVDGVYDDWAAVSRETDLSASQEASVNSNLKESACVFDGEYVYIYLKNAENGSAANAGSSSNGRYSITTDTGRQITFQLTAQNGGTVNGVDGAVAAYFGDEWEIAIPASALPPYNESISFGLYQEEPFNSGVMNLQGNTANGNLGTAGEFTGIVYDGMYGDWKAYPHTLIQYATTGTNINAPDGEGALYTAGSTLYGHVTTAMDDHVSQRGEEFTKSVSICFNGDRDYNGDKTWNLYPRIVAVADDGTINWNPSTNDLENGSYEFYIADIRGEYNTSAQTNIADLGEHEQFLGKMMINVADNNNEMEFYVDLEQAAKFLSYYSDTEIDASDFKLIEAQFGQIGSDYLATAGTSSGPYMGIIICMAVVGLVLLKRRRVEVIAE